MALQVVPIFVFKDNYITSLTGWQYAYGSYYELH